MRFQRILRFFMLTTLVLGGISTKAQRRMEQLRADYDSLGNTSGAYLFHKEKGANLRILDMNIWNWDGTREELPKAWAAITPEQNR